MEAFEVDDDEESVDSAECASSTCPGPEEAISTDVSVAACLTGHLADANSLDSLRAAWASVLAQHDQPDWVLLSLSHSPALRDEAVIFQEDVEREAAAIGISAKVLLESAPSVRMLRLQSLTQELSGMRCESTTTLTERSQLCWAVFGDADGLWHPGRIRSYRRTASKKSAARVLLSPLSCRLDGSGDDAQPGSVADVEQLLEKGRAVLEGEERLPEYFDYAARLDALTDFFKHVPEPLLSLRHGDMALVSFFETLGIERQSVVPVGSCWMYFCRDCLLPRSDVGLNPAQAAGMMPGSGGYASISADQAPMASSLRSQVPVVLTRDRARAEEELLELARKQPGLTVEDLAVAAALCREWMEGICLSMWIGGPYTPSQLQLLARKVLKNVQPPVPRRPGQEELSEWSKHELKTCLIPKCEELGLVRREEPG